MKSKKIRKMKKRLSELDPCPEVFECDREDPDYLRKVVEDIAKELEEKRGKMLVRRGL